MCADILPFEAGISPRRSSSRSGKSRTPEGQERRNQERKEEVDRRLKAADPLAATIRQQKLSPTTREQFALNLGRYSEEVFGSEPEARRRFPDLFKAAFGRQHDSFLKKRKRLIRLDSEREEARGGPEGYGQYHARGDAYVDLAIALSDFDTPSLSERRDRQRRAVLRLASGTEFDDLETLNSNKGRVRSEAEKSLDDLLTRLLRKLRPELDRYHQAVLKGAKSKGFLLGGGSHLEDIEIDELPHVTVMTIGQDLPPFHSIPLGFNVGDLISRTLRLLEDPSTLAEFESHYDGELDRPVPAMPDEQIVRFAWFWALHGKRWVLQQAAHALGVKVTGHSAKALALGVLERAGPHYLSILRLLQRDREALGSLFQVDASATSNLTAEELLSEIVEEFGTLEAFESAIAPAFRATEAERKLKPTEEVSAQAEASSTKADADLPVDRGVAMALSAMESLISRFEQRRARREKDVELLFREQKLRLHVSRDLALFPFIDDVTHAWRLGIGFVPQQIHAIDDVRPCCFDAGPAADLAGSPVELLAHFWLRVMPSGLRAVPLPDGEMVAIGYTWDDETGEVHLVCYEDAYDLLVEEAYPHLNDPLPRTIGSYPAGVQQDDAMSLLMKEDPEAVRHGRIACKLPTGEHPMFSPSSLAARLYEDLSRHNPNGPEPTASLIYTGLRDSLIKEAEAYEMGVAAIKAEYKKRFAWLDER